jgi:hypothetical protein
MRVLTLSFKGVGSVGLWPGRLIVDVRELGVADRSGSLRLRIFDRSNLNNKTAFCPLKWRSVHLVNRGRGKAREMTPSMFNHPQKRMNWMVAIAGTGTPKLRGEDSQNN